jgi:plastocyanin
MLAFAVAAGLLFGASHVIAQPAAAPGQITIDNFAFEPANLTIKAGTTVEWLNRDEEPHTVVGVDPALPFKSPALDTGDKYSQRFDKPGTYKYFCSIHSHMVGTIVVQ